MTVAEIQKETQRLIQCYSEQVLSVRTRRVELLGRKCEPQLMYTFLGFELKLGPKRLTCPDMTTARYLRVFGKLGVDSVEIPYDLTQTARVLPLLERALERINRLLESGELKRAQRQERTWRTYRRVRQGLKDAEQRAE